MARMKPFFPYFGSKYRLAKRYPEPGSVVIEPFAGSACYSTYWGVTEARLYDIDPNIAAVWNYLLTATPDDIWALPNLELAGDTTDGLEEGPAALIGFWLTKSSKPVKKRGVYAASDAWRHLFWREEIKERIAGQLDQIRGWTFEQADYRLSEKFIDSGTTTFIDPPYIEAGHHYKHGFSEYKQLGDWCRSIPGRVIVCEGRGAEWLPFRSLGQVKSFTTGLSEEQVWLSRTSNG